MKKEFKFSLIDGCVSVTKRNEIPARFTSVGGDTYAVGTIIDLCEVVTMKPISVGGNNWQGVGSIINGSHVVIGANTLITDHMHGHICKEELKLSPKRRSLFSRGPVHIQKNVWLPPASAIDCA